jgi:MOSC domain-containing protein
LSARVAWISLTPVKATRLHLVDEAELRESGVRGDRRFYLVEERGLLVNDKHLGALQLVESEYDEATGRLALRFPGGLEVTAGVELGDEVETTFHGLARSARVVLGPFADALTEYTGRPLRVVEPALPAPDRGRSGAVTLLATSSLARLADELGVAAVDGRRFRMNIGIEGLEAHGEDAWHGRRVRVGEAVVVPQGNVGRCAVTTQNPDTGRRDLDTLGALAAYRTDVETTEPLPFGVHAAVVEPGAVRIGDPVGAIA